MRGRGPHLRFPVVRIRTFGFHKMPMRVRARVADPWRVTRVLANGDGGELVLWFSAG